MAITQAMCTSFKQELLEGVHNFTTGGNAFKLALYAVSAGGKAGTTATLGAATTAFTTTGEVATSGSYTTGGGVLTKVSPTVDGTTAITDFADLSFTTATITARGAMIYNNTQAIKNLMDDIQAIKRALLLLPTIQGALNVTPSPRVPAVVQEVEG